SEGLDASGLEPARLKLAGFEGRSEQVTVWPGEGPATVLIGLGERQALTAQGLRRAAAAFGRAVRRHEGAALHLGPAVEVLGDKVATQAVIEGMTLGLYEFLAHKSKPSPSPLSSVWLLGAGQGGAEGLERGHIVSESVLWARDLVNEPGGKLSPRALADAAKAFGEAAGVTVKVRTRKEIKAMGLGGLLGVNRGSANPPRFIELRWRPSGEVRASVALVGKGITFDSGGLSIKTGTGMMTMKSDMAGAAAVMAAVAAVARLKLPVEVRVYVSATDNMTGPDAMRPGDVLQLRNGKTIEVLNTDAEGRLVLADALSVASENKPDAIIDLATLTGACRAALGAKIAGVMGNNEGWLSQVEAAAGRVGEPVWRLPLPPEYRKQIESNVADMKNIGSGEGGALVAGLILQEFVGEGIPWAHLDIAGPAFVDGEDGEYTKGATGFGTRLLVDLVEQFAKP
ncbi:MAG: leucyl aminopeptidase, partial [Acidimicrobiia bacterium]|nr:leucyl aminopeptidase [Acidimicrobiia bacterium]